MEELKNIENTTVEIVEEVTDKLTFGENCLSYALGGTFIIGVAAIGYLGYKGTKKIVKTIKGKKKITEESEQKIVDVDQEDIHEVENDETEQD